MKITNIRQNSFSRAVYWGGELRVELAIAHDGKRLSLKQIEQLIADLASAYNTLHTEPESEARLNEVQ